MTHDRIIERRPRRRGRRMAGALASLAALGLTASPAVPGAEGDELTAEQRQMVQHLQSMAPYRGYLRSHAKERKPLGLIGGPIEVTVTQDSGGVFVALPDKRELDPHVFGHPGLERAFAGTPGINGVPTAARSWEQGGYGEFTHKSPFGDKHKVMAKGQLRLEAVDATATDAARSEDSVSFQASWQDGQGNTYAVRCCVKLATHGVEFPTFGGVVTNHILHGSSRIGTALMPTEFTYVAFWGMGEVRKNGKTLDKPRLVHGMLTEYVRTSGYELGGDEEITPTRRHFHLMVPPMKPNPEAGRFEKDPVATGLSLPNGMTLPFWHVMFENLVIESGRAS